VADTPLAERAAVLIAESVRQHGSTASEIDEVFAYEDAVDACVDCYVLRISTPISAAVK
jgi:hypothetical protein